MADWDAAPRDTAGQTGSKEIDGREPVGVEELDSDLQHPRGTTLLPCPV